MNLEDIAEHIQRIVIRPVSRQIPPGIAAWSWEVTMAQRRGSPIDLRFEPPHHFSTATAPLLDEAMQLAIMRAQVHIAIAPR